MDFSGFNGNLLTYNEAIISFVNKKHFRGGWEYHGSGWSDGVWTIPFFRFGKPDTTGDDPGTILKWLEFDLIPQDFKSNETKKLFKDLKGVYAKYKDYLHAANDKISLDQDKIFKEVLAGKEFDFLPDAKKILAANTVPSSNEFVNALRDKLLNGDKIRANIDSYDANILIDPNRRPWDLWDYGAANNPQAK